MWIAPDIGIFASSQFARTFGCHPGVWLCVSVVEGSHRGYTGLYRSDFVILRGLSAEPCKIQIGAMNCGIDIQGVIGFDFIRAANLVIDTEEMSVYPKTKGAL